ncbi:hypothetical protein [Hymenobacter antarcticus]|uniref:Uncharacterized protein n=1 Tax=Hymenobacter antarcticus TaxID=486270 RepID=A0ABP7P7F3_9BACT
MRLLRPFALIISVSTLAGCHKEPLCGDPALGKFVTYEIVDAATGRDWFAGPGRPPGDSLRLLASAFGPARPATRFRTGFRVGPVVVDGRLMRTHLLRISTTDLDTVMVQLRYGPAPADDPCGFGPALAALEITYNGRPAGTFRADVPTDSLSAIYRPVPWGKVLALRKRR